MSTGLKVNHIAQVSVRVYDLEVASAFYQNILGLQLLFQTSNMAFLDCDGTRILLGIAEDERFDHPSSVIYFNVDDIDQTYQAMLEAKVKFLDKPHRVAKMGQVETWMCFFHDPDENIHALVTEITVTD